jgi:hypothetical protein
MAKIAAWMLVGGVVSSVGALTVFFGGSERDPAWLWALFYLLFYGGIAAAITGLVLLLAGFGTRRADTSGEDQPSQTQTDPTDP